MEREASGFSPAALAASAAALSSGRCAANARSPGIPSAPAMRATFEEVSPETSQT